MSIARVITFAALLPIIAVGGIALALAGTVGRGLDLLVAVVPLRPQSH